MITPASSNIIVIDCAAGDMCLHIWNLYQRHTWSSLVVVRTDGDSTQVIMLKLWFPACSALAAIHHEKSSSSPLYREFTATKGRKELSLEVELFGVACLELPLEWRV